MGELSLGTLYEANKQIMKNQKPIPTVEKAAIQEKIANWFNWKIDAYAMLLCRERYDFTVFHLYEKENPNPPALAAKELMECIQNRGELLSAEELEDGAWEIWVKIDDEPFVYYLFNYDEAVIEV
jgi:hypothetical protein